MDAFMRDRDSLVERLVNGPYAEPALVPSAPWLEGGVPDEPIARLSTSPEGVELLLIPGAGIASAAARVQTSTAPGAAQPAAAPADRTRAQPAVENIRETRMPRWWLVRARYLDGWRAVLVDASERSIRLGRDASGAAPDIVTVTAIDHAGVASSPAFAR
jgi:hypothetical protein